MKNIAADFPILNQPVYGRRLTYLDSAASTQKPLVVIEAISHFLKNDYANIHRGVYFLSQRSTMLFESARTTVQKFLNAKESREIVFVRGTTEGINLIAQTFGKQRVQKGDEIILSGMEHHSNIVPWQMLCEQTGAVLKIIPIQDDGSLLLSDFEKLLSSKTKLISIVHVSNALGTLNPIEKIIELAHAKNIPVVIDGAQSAGHMPIDVQKLDCDFFVFSGHKVYGPTGIGCVYGKYEHLSNMPPFQGGGEMIESVTFEKTTYKLPPEKFEAGTPDIMGAVGLKAAIEYIQTVGYEAITSHEADLLAYAHEELLKIKGLKIIGTAPKKSGVVSFTIEGLHPHDIATILDQEGVAIRAGHHCAQPVMDRFNVPATNRASFGIYNTKEDVDALVSALQKVLEIFA